MTDHTHAVEIRVPSHVRLIIRGELVALGSVDLSTDADTDPVIGAFPDVAAVRAFKDHAAEWTHGELTSPYARARILS